MGPGMFDGFESFMIAVSVLLVVFVPLGLWKFIEIIIWLFHHVHFS